MKTNMKYKYTRKEIWDNLTKFIRINTSTGRYTIDPDDWFKCRKDLLAQKEDKKECKHKFSSKDCRCFYCGKEITSGTIGNSIPSPLELPKINNNFSSMEQYNWAKQITDEVNKLYQLIKDKL